LIQKINGRFIAACPYDQRSDTVLDAEDLRSFRITMPALVREIATASGLADDPSQVAPGVWHLGSLPTRRLAFLALARSAALQKGLVGVLRQVDRTSQVTLISPELTAAERMRFAEAGIVLAIAVDCLAHDDGAAAFAIDQAKLEPPPAFAPRLVICRSAKSVTLDGTPKTLADQSFKLLVLLAEQALRSPAVLENRRIEEQLWGSAVHRISSESREPVRALRDALAAGRADIKAVRSLIENRRNPNGYRLALTSEDIQLSP
jgi:DNA-binding response OmpR family regulator